MFNKTRTVSYALLVGILGFLALWNQGVRADDPGLAENHNKTTLIKDIPLILPGETVYSGDTLRSETRFTPFYSLKKAGDHDKEERLVDNNTTDINKPGPYGATSYRKFLPGIEGFSVSGSLLRPVGSFTHQSELGYGMTFSLYSSIQYIPRLSLILAAGFYNINDNDTDITSYRLFTIRTCMGYGFPFRKRCTAMFFAGIASITHYFVRDHGEEHTREYNTYTGVTAGWEIRYTLTKRADFFLGPIFTYSPRESGESSFVTGCAGIRFIY